MRMKNLTVATPWRPSRSALSDFSGRISFAFRRKRPMMTSMELGTFNADPWKTRNPSRKFCQVPTRAGSAFTCAGWGGLRPAPVCLVSGISPTWPSELKYSAVRDGALTRQSTDVATDGPAGIAYIGGVPAGGSRVSHPYPTRDSVPAHRRVSRRAIERAGSMT